MPARSLAIVESPVVTPISPGARPPALLSAAREIRAGSDTISLRTAKTVDALVAFEDMPVVDRKLPESVMMKLSWSPSVTTRRRPAPSSTTDAEMFAADSVAVPLMALDLLIGLLQTFAVSLDWSFVGGLANLGVTVPPDAFGFPVLSLTLAQVAPVLPYLLLVLVLIFRPRGLMGTRET